MPQRRHSRHSYSASSPASARQRVTSGLCAKGRRQNRGSSQITQDMNRACVPGSRCSPSWRGRKKPGRDRMPGHEALKTIGLQGRKQSAMNAPRAVKLDFKSPSFARTRLMDDCKRGSCNLPKATMGTSISRNEMYATTVVRAMTTSTLTRLPVQVASGPRSEKTK